MNIIDKCSILIIFAIAINSCKEKGYVPSKEEILTQMKHISKAKEYSDYAIRIMSLEDSLIVERNRVNTYIELLEKSIKEGKKADTTILNLVKKGYGHEYYYKYLKGIEMQLIGYKDGNSKSLSQGQILYDEYLDWHEENMR